MRKKLLWLTILGLPLAIGGWVYAGVQASDNDQGNDVRFVCPVTSEELPCRKCCPLN